MRFTCHVLGFDFLADYLNAQIDSILSARGGASEHEASRRLKTEFLVRLDGVSSDPSDEVPSHDSDLEVVANGELLMEGFNCGGHESSSRA